MLIAAQGNARRTLAWYAWRVPELADERYVRELLNRLYGVRLCKVWESDVKTFDYELLDGVRVAGLEIKRFEWVRLTAEVGAHEDPSSGFMVREDNASSRVAAAIHDKWKQLRTCAETKVLVFVNDEFSMDALDFEEAFEGFLFYGTPETGYVKNTASAKIANGRIREEKGMIDLYIWINRYGGQTLWGPSGPLSEAQRLGPFFRFTTEAGYQLARAYFGCRDRFNG
jgi:hypothetical protein